MDREYLVKQLMDIAKQNGMEIDADILGVIINKAVFRVVAKDSILQNVGEETKKMESSLVLLCIKEVKGGAPLRPQACFPATFHPPPSRQEG